MKGKRFVGIIIAMGLILFGSFTHVAAEHTQVLTFTKNGDHFVSDHSVTMDQGEEKHVYTFTLSQPQKVNLLVDSGKKRLIVYLKNNDGDMLIGMNNELSSVEKNVEEIGLPPGEYTIDIYRRFDWEGPIPYQLKVELSDLNFYEIEYNGSFATANEVMLNTRYYGNTQKRNTVMDNFLDYDYYTFHVPVKGNYGFNISDGIRVNLYDQNQKYIDEIRDWNRTVYELSPGQYYLRFYRSSFEYGLKPYTFEINYLKFNDIAKHWAAKEIGFLSDSSIINGYDDGTFKPDQEVTRYEAAVMITRALQLNTSGRPAPKFKDVPRNHWAYPYVAAVVDENIFANTSHFNGNKPLSREEMAKVLVNAYQLTGSSDRSFKDVPAHRWSYNYISTLAHNRITEGYTDGTFKPSYPVTRAQFAVFLARLMDDRYKPIN